MGKKGERARQRVVGEVPHECRLVRADADEQVTVGRAPQPTNARLVSFATNSGNVRAPVAPWLLMR